MHTTNAHRLSSPHRPSSLRRLAVVAATLALGLTVFAAPAGAAAPVGPAALASAAPARPSAIRPALTTRQLARHMLALLNKERHTKHLRPLRMNPKLITSASRHTARMIRTNTLSHQLRGERSLGPRISATGYRWSVAGENIGWSTERNLTGLLGLERAMFNEKPPNDGHRLNILSRQFRQVGIAVRIDNKHHKIWFTQDFARPR